MRIGLAFDDQLLVRYAQRGAELVFGIAWEHEGDFYPSEDWTDFGEVILGWWFGATLRLLSGADEDAYDFMDGPYSVVATYDRQIGVVELKPQRTASIWRVPIVNLCSELARAANTVDAEMARVGLRDQGQPRFRAIVETLREELANAST